MRHLIEKLQGKNLTEQKAVIEEEVSRVWGKTFDSLTQQEKKIALVTYLTQTGMKNSSAHVQILAMFDLNASEKFVEKWQGVSEWGVTNAKREFYSPQRAA